MNALFYLHRKKLKNEIKSLFLKPARLIYMLFLLACIALTIVGGSASDGLPGHVYRDTAELTAAASALFLIMFVMTADKGFSRGGSLFTMPDVNLLFPAPIRPQVLLFHGLLQQMVTSLLVGFFLLFQYANLHNVYGITFPLLLVLLLAYALSVFLGQVTAMLLYSLTNGNERRQRLGRLIFYGVIGAFVLYAVAFALRDGRAFVLPNAVLAVNSGVFQCLPVVGWLNLIVGGTLSANPIFILLGCMLCFAYLCLLVFLIFRMDPDYYEDVLDGAERLQSAVTAKKEGTMQEAAPRKIKLGRTGFQHGWGASTFYYKHCLENRRARKFLLSTNALIFAAVVIVFAAFLKNTGLVPVFIMSTYLQIFSSLSGRINQELLRPYVYLVPEPPFRKLLWSLAELLPTAAAEAVVVFVPVGAILHLSVPVILACVLARISFAMVFTGAGLVVDRLWGGSVSRVLTIFLFLAAALVLALPGLAAAILLSAVWEAGTALTLCAAAVCNVPMSLLALFLCRNMLEYAELNYQ